MLDHIVYCVRDGWNYDVWKKYSETLDDKTIADRYLTYDRFMSEYPVFIDCAKSYKRLFSGIKENWGEMLEDMQETAAVSDADVTVTKNSTPKLKRKFNLSLLYETKSFRVPVDTIRKNKVDFELAMDSVKISCLHPEIMWSHIYYVTQNYMDSTSLACSEQPYLVVALEEGNKDYAQDFQYILSTLLARNTDTGYCLVNRIKTLPTSDILMQKFLKIVIYKWLADTFDRYSESMDDKTIIKEYLSYEKFLESYPYFKEVKINT